MLTGKVKVGVLGVGRGSVLWRYSKISENAQLVAVCDKWTEGIERAKKDIADTSVSFYSDFDEFLKHDMDIVFLANYANEHAPFAIKAMKAGKNVVSEVLPVQTMKEAVELIECVESTGMKYYYAENYCFMNGPFEMKKLYQKGELGEFEYGEGEYLHNCEAPWPELTHGNPSHWRNTMSAFYYCTHSAGPLLHITGLRPIKVVGIEGLFNTRMARMGAKAGNCALEIVTLENGAMFKSLHGGGPSKDSIWFSVYGSKGRAETSRDVSHCGGFNTLYTDLDTSEGVGYEKGVIRYNPGDENAKKGTYYGIGHGGSDYVCLWNIFENLRGNKSTDVVNVYEAIDMWMVGFFGYLSVLNGGITMEIPDLRDEITRENFRNDTRCTDETVAGEQLLPSYSKGTPIIDDLTYKNIEKEFIRSLSKTK